MNTCPACKYKEGADPEQRCEHVGDVEFEKITQPFVVYDDRCSAVYLYICPKCGCVSRQW